MATILAPSTDPDSLTTRTASSGFFKKSSWILREKYGIEVYLKIIIHYKHSSYCIEHNIGNSTSHSVPMLFGNSYPPLCLAANTNIRCRGVVVELSNHLTGDAKVVGSIPSTAPMSLSKAFYLHCFSPPRCKWVPGRMRTSLWLDKLMRL